jgi:membrane protein YdbS with pleckstrin-like domain
MLIKTDEEYFQARIDMGEINVWRKVAVLIIAIIWIAISYGVAVSMDLPVWEIVVALGVLWLVFVVIAYIITKNWSQ